MNTNFVQDLLRFTLRNRVTRAWALSVCEFVAQEHRFTCDHVNCTADKLEGDHAGDCITTCRSCGSVRRMQGNWGLP